MHESDRYKDAGKARGDVTAQNVNWAHAAENDNIPQPRYASARDDLNVLEGLGGGTGGGEGGSPLDSLDMSANELEAEVMTVSFRFEVEFEG